jgi:hypothetical protein
VIFAERNGVVTVPVGEHGFATRRCDVWTQRPGERSAGCDPRKIKRPARISLLTAPVRLTPYPLEVVPDIRVGKASQCHCWQRSFLVANRSVHHPERTRRVEHEERKNQAFPKFAVRPPGPDDLPSRKGYRACEPQAPYGPAETPRPRHRRLTSSSMCSPRLTLGGDAALPLGCAGPGSFVGRSRRSTT